VAELLREAMADFRREDSEGCPDEKVLQRTWPALREELRQAASRYPCHVLLDEQSAINLQAGIRNPHLPVFSLKQRAIASAKALAWLPALRRLWLAA